MRNGECIHINVLPPFPITRFLRARVLYVIHVFRHSFDLRHTRGLEACLQENLEKDVLRLNLRAFQDYSYACYISQLNVIAIV